MKKYIARPNTWYDEGTEVTLLADCGVFGLFLGSKDGKLDEESCPWNEFEIINAS